jgi:hypothetical protein
VKALILYSITFLFSIALGYETINYCYQKISEQTFCEHHDLDCEENKTESKSSEKTEKEGVFDDLFMDGGLHSDSSIDLAPRQFKLNNLLSSTDYSKMIYSPPELILL